MAGERLITETDPLDDNASTLYKIFQDKILANREDLKLYVTGVVEEKSNYVLKWGGQRFIGSTMIGEASGRIRVPRAIFSSEDTAVQLDRMTVVCDGEETRQAGVNSECWGRELKARELDPVEKQLKALLISDCLDTIRAKIGEIVRNTSSGASIFQTPSEASNALPNDLAGFIDRVTLDNKGDRYHTAISVLQKLSKSEEVPTSYTCGTLDLSFSNLEDRDIPLLLKALNSGCMSSSLKTLKLQHNKFGDVGIQQLVIALANGTAPCLAHLQISTGNNYTVAGQNMLKGLILMRKGVRWD